MANTKTVKIVEIGLIMALFLAVFSVGEGETKEKTIKEIFKGRAISIRILQEKAKKCTARGKCPENISKLCGLTKVDGFVIDEKNNDIILFGNVDPSLSALYLEDFVVALRNAWLKYAVLKGNTYYYSNPGCSIDPNRRVIDRLVRLKGEIIGRRSSRGGEGVIKRWCKICESPQRVRVLGIPFDTHFAWVMVKADYDMKKIVDGSDVIGIPGLVSLSDMTLDKIKRELLQGHKSSIPLYMMNRFWFYPGRVRCWATKEDDLVLLKRCEVILLTEEQYLSKGGHVQGRGRPNPLAKEFARVFTKRYQDVANKKPIYRELEGLFRFVGLAKAMKLIKAFSRAQLDANYLLSQYEVPIKSVSRTLPGHANVKRFTRRRDVPGGYEILQLFLPSCGGVGIDIEISYDNFDYSASKELYQIRKAVLESRPEPSALYWEFPMKGRVENNERQWDKNVVVLLRAGDKVQEHI